MFLPPAFLARFILTVLFFGFMVQTGLAADDSMVLIPAGEFQAGPPGREKPMTLPAFYLDRTEVTQRQYESVTGHNPSFFEGPDRPVDKVNWFKAEAYCKEIGKRLPTEWEWEKAVKAGTQSRYYWGDTVDGAYAWYKANSGKSTHPVGTRKPNAFGLYDMAGNVWEWTASDYSVGVFGKVKRGGSWRNTERSLASAYRVTSLPHYQYHYVGFRCARSVE